MDNFLSPRKTIKFKLKSSSEELLFAMGGINPQKNDEIKLKAVLSEGDFCNGYNPPEKR